MANYRWLRCEVQRGMLGEEFAVAVNTSGGRASLFASAEKVAEVTGSSGLLMVEMLDYDAQHGLVRLPSGSIEGPSIVRVDKSELTTR